MKQNIYQTYYSFINKQKLQSRLSERKGVLLVTSVLSERQRSQRLSAGVPVLQKFLIIGNVMGTNVKEVVGTSTPLDQIPSASHGIFPLCHHATARHAHRSPHSSPICTSQQANTRFFLEQHSLGKSLFRSHAK